MTSSNGASPRPTSGWFERASELYASADLRALGAFRVLFAGLLLAELARRAQHLTLFYSNEGVLSNHFTLYSPQADPQWSLLFAASTPGEATALFGLIGLANVALLVGYYTRAAQWVSLVGLMSLNARNLFLEDRGVTLLLVLGVFTALLPLGARFSIDALVRAARSERPEARPSSSSPLVSVAFAALVVEAVCVYAFDALQKSGPTWRQGEAAHYLLWQSHVVTPLGLWLRTREPGFFSPLFTYATYLGDAAIALLVLSPRNPERCRAIALGVAVALHGSAALFWNFGSFPMAAMALLVALQRPGSLDALGRWLSQRLRPAGAPRELAYDAALPGPRRAAALLAALDPFGALAPRDAHEVNADDPSDARDAQNASDTSDGNGSDPLSVAGGVKAAFALRSGESFQPDPAGEAALAALPIARHGSFVLRPILHSWLAMPPEPSPPPEARARGPFARGSDLLREAMASALLLAVVLQMSVDYSAWPKALSFGPPPPLTALVRYPRIFQSWSAFAPDVPKEDGSVVIDAVRGDGRHVDPLTGAEPAPERVNEGAATHDRLVSSYLSAIKEASNQAYHRDLKGHFEDSHRRSTRPRGERIAQFKIYWASQDSPPPGQTTPTNYRRRLITEGDASRR